MIDKILCIVTVAVFAAFYSNPEQANYKIIESQKTEIIASYLVSIPANDFKKEILVQLATDFLQHHSNARLLRVGVYTDRATALDSKGKNIDHFAYGQWLNEFTARKRRRPSGAAELLSTGTDATLRIRYADGHMEEVAIAGQNVFHPTVNGITLNLLDVTYASQGFPTKQLTPHFYFSVPNRITMQEASALAESLLRTYRIPEMKIQLRSDEWFVFDSGYPWLNPFAAAQTPPTEAELAQTEEFLCNPGKEPTCYATSVKAKE